MRLLRRVLLKLGTARLNMQEDSLGLRVVWPDEEDWSSTMFPPQGRKRGSVLPGGAFCTVEPAGFRVAGLLDGREGADMDIDGVNGPNRDSPTTGYRAIDSAGVVLWEAKSGVCGAAVGILDERGGNNAVVDGLVDLNASSPSPSTTVASRCDICCAERKCSSLSQSGLLPSHWWLMLTDLLLLLLSQL